MSFDRKSRRDFLRTLACLAASGGASALMPQLRMIGTALAAQSPKLLSGYKALVCVYLAGGNDSWNVLVPYDVARFNVYAASRSGVYNASTNPGGIALAMPATAGEISAQVITDANDASSATNQYFMHPSMPEMATLFRQNHLALVANVGTLVRPIVMSDYSASATNRPPQLFSHSDQENLWHQANTNGNSATGWGGLAGDIVRTSNNNAQLSPCISIAGASRFEVGVSTVPYQMSSNGLSSLNGVCNPSCGGNSSQRNTALNALLGDTYANDFPGEYAKVFQRGRDLYALLSAGLASTTLTTTFPSGNSLATQLQTVAKMIKLSMAQNYAARQIYYVRMGGFDMHDGLMGTGTTAHAALLTQVSLALNAFWTAMGPTDVNAQNNVTLFTASEFARTLSSNGHGSDHAWGGVQMVLGGAVTGGRIYANGGGSISGFPNQALNAPNNFSRGQMIPGIGVEQYGATLAQWMGITAPSDLNSIFANLPSFSSSNLGFV